MVVRDLIDSELPGCRGATMPRRSSASKLSQRWRKGELFSFRTLNSHSPAPKPASMSGEWSWWPGNSGVDIDFCMSIDFQPAAQVVDTGIKILVLAAFCPHFLPDLLLAV